MLLAGLRAAALGTLLPLAVAPLADAQTPLPGQIVIDPAHPQWLMRHGGGHVFFCGTGDPEDFFYRGTRLPDGTRDGDQDELIDKLIAQGGNTLYLEVVRSHGGDGQSDHNPFINSDENQGLDQDILDQWEGWMQRCEDNDILIYLFIYDDSALIWSSGNQVNPPEDTFLRAIVDEFEHHPNLIWLVAEESEEAMSDSKARKIAAVIANADDHGHIVGGHHHSGTTFKAWQDGSAFNHYSLHYDIAASAVHTGTLEARDKGVAAGAAGNGYFTMFTEASYIKTASDNAVRLFLWDCSMAGVMPMIYGADIANTSDQVLNWCRIVEQFFEATDFYRMESRDDLVHGGSKWVLADPPHGYIAYADGPNGDLGLTSMTAGFYDLRWVDTVTGTTVTETGLTVASGDQTFARPAGIGDECAVWVSRRWLDLGNALIGTQGLPNIVVESTMEEGDPITLDLTNARPSSLTYIVVGFSYWGVPFQGGTFVPTLDVLAFGLTNGAGELSVNEVFPSFPSGASAWIQCWIVDPLAPFGYAGSNGVQGTSP